MRALRLLDERPLPARLQLAGGASGRASVRRVGPDLFLVLGNGAAGQARARAGLLVRIVSVASLLAPFPAALASGGGSVESSAHVAVLPPGAPPPGWPAAACDPAAGDTLTLVFGDAARPGVLSTGPLTVRSPDVSGSPPIAESPAQGASTGLGPLSWDMLARRADRSESGTLMLAPVAGAGGCDRAAPANWGDPHDRTSPCWSYLPLIYAPGDLHLAGGSGQGVLVVRGRLTMDAGTEFYGPILVGGGVDVATGATVWGAVASTALNWQGTANYSACALLRALGGAPGLGRPFRTGSRLWAHFF